MKKSFVMLKSITVVLAALTIIGSMSRFSVSATTELNSSRTPVRAAASLTSATTAAVQTTMPTTSVYALSNNNSIYVLTNTTTGLAFTFLTRPTGINGNLIGFDFRPADGNSNSVYALTDTGKIYTINLGSTGLGTSTLISTLSPRFAGGFQSLMDFNPIANALRVIGSNDQNFAVVNSNGGNLNTTAVQTALAYAAGDVNAGVNPNIACGAYTNNNAGATATIFYAIDYDLDTFVTIAGPPTATGSSNTGGGQLQTIGPIVTAAGARVNFAPETDIDIYTSPTGVNTIVGINGGNILYTIDLAQINTSLPLGTTQNVVVRAVSVATLPADVGFIDVTVKQAPR